MMTRYLDDDDARVAAALRKRLSTVLDPAAAAELAVARRPVSSRAA